MLSKNIDYQRTADTVRRHRLWNRVALLACCGPASLGYANIAHAQDAAPPAATSADNTNTDDDIVVTGTSIRGAQPTGSELVTIGRDQITRSTAANTANLFATLPISNTFNTAPEQVVGFAGSNAASPPSLRGLPAGATLVLLNGHRLIGVSPLSTTPDPTALPLEAIERIEIVPDGSSAIYGSDAVAGVINIITRKNYNGASVSGRYGIADIYRSFDGEASFGRKWTGGSFLLAGSYTGNNPLYNKDIDAFRPNLAPNGATDFRQIFCTPPNIVIGPTTYVPPNYAAGAPSKCENDRNFAILGKNRRLGLLASFNQELTPNLELFADGNYTSTTNVHRQQSLSADVMIASTNPFFRAPPGTSATSEGVQFNLGSILPPNDDRFRTKAGGGTVGLNWKVSDAWQALVTATYGRSQSTAFDQGFNAAALTTAANGTTAATALDPFGTGTSATVAKAIGNYGITFQSKQTLFDLTAKLDGSLFALPGGEVKIAVGGGYRRETYGGQSYTGPSNGSGTTQRSNGGRTIASGFGELLVPLVGADMNVPAVRKLIISGAVRYDHYNDFGSTTNPKIGAMWELTDGVTLRGSYGTSFHAPSLADTDATDTRAILFLGFPLGIGPTGSLVIAPNNTIVLAGGNPTLKPETATSWSGGLELAPEALRGFKANFNFYDINYRNQITSLFTFFPFPFFTDPNIVAVGVVSSPTSAQVGAITSTYALENFTTPLPTINQILDLRRLNLSERHVRGIDFDIRYDTSSSIGALGFVFSGNKTLSYKLKSVPGAKALNLLNNGFGEIPWRLRGEFDWSKGPVAITASFSYTGDYKFSYVTTPGAAAIQTVKSYATANIQLRYDIPAKLIASKVSLFVNVDNVFDRDPPIVFGQTYGFDPTRTNPIGRMFWMGVRAQF